MKLIILSFIIGLLIGAIMKLLEWLLPDKDTPPLGRYTMEHIDGSERIFRQCYRVEKTMEYQSLYEQGIAPALRRRHDELMEQIERMDLLAAYGSYAERMDGLDK